LIHQTKPHKEQRELFRFSLFSYIGVFVGVLSNLFIYTQNQEFLGVLRYTESIAFLLWPLILMGASSSLINFTPKLQEHNNTKLFSYALFRVLRNGVFVFLLIFFGADLLSDYMKLEFIYFAFCLAFCLGLIDLLKKQLSIHQKIAFPTILDNLLPKLVLPTIFILLYYAIIDTNTKGLGLYNIAYLLILMALFVFASKRKTIGLTTKISSIFTHFTKKEYRNYSYYAVAGSLGYLFVFKLDTLMIPNLISYKANGVYSIAAVAASVIFIPARGLFSLYAPQVSKLVKENKYEHLNKLYKASAKTLLFLGLLIYSGLFLGVEMLFHFLPSKEVLLETVSVIFIIGATSVINMATGFNSEIINFSRFYRFNIIALSILTMLNLVANYYFIVVLNHGIEGAAFASMLAILVYNLIKLVFIYFRLGLLPFDLVFMKLLAVQLILMLIFYSIPDSPSTLFNLCFKVGCALISQLFIVYKLKWVEPLNTFVDEKILRKPV